MKRLICLILISCLLTLGLTSCNNSANYLGATEREDGTVAVWQDEAMYLSRVTIPSRIDGKPVAAIASGAFFMNDNLRTIKIMAGPTSIGKSAFYFCTNLEKVTLPNTINEIGPSAFECCYSLKEFKIPKRVTHIQSNTFCRCSSLEVVEIPAGVTQIAKDAFAQCTSLKTIRFGGNEEEWKVLCASSPELANVSVVYGK